jgi:uncharacterized membrane protein YecN with MAPEG domain
MFLWAIGGQVNVKRHNVNFLSFVPIFLIFLIFKMLMQGTDTIKIFYILLEKCASLHLPSETPVTPRKTPWKQKLSRHK